MAAVKCPRDTHIETHSRILQSVEIVQLVGDLNDLLPHAADDIEQEGSDLLEKRGHVVPQAGELLQESIELTLDLHPPVDVVLLVPFVFICSSLRPLVGLEEVLFQLHLPLSCPLFSSYRHLKKTQNNVENEKK